MKIFGIDPGSHRTGYGCLHTDGSHHRLLDCGALSPRSRAVFPEKLLAIYDGLTALLARWQPDWVAVETLFHARNVQSALRLGHARGVALLAATRAGIPIAEYAPAEIKRAVVGYGRAEKHQVQEMVRLLLGLQARPSPPDVADALAVALCHVQSGRAGLRGVMSPAPGVARSWRTYRPAGHRSP